MNEVATTVDDIAAGLAAWARLRESGRKNWHDWICVARALVIGRTAALKAAGTNRPLGSKYNAEMSRWLVDHQLDGVVAQERYKLFLILENLDAIEAWRASLGERQRRTLNHPNAIVTRWRQSMKAEKPSPQPPQIAERAPAVAETVRRGRPVFWSQDAMRRAHRAMLDSRSSDLLTLARVALEAAIRTEGDLLALLDTPRRPLPGNAAVHATA